ncbi:MAG: Gfo/Idh/MocA family oxidoreductase [Acidobacteria bacterium]|nr:Gfo/Idh/MocA family oxidoreductase [Acidobacteriota bacterium]
MVAVASRELSRADSVARAWGIPCAVGSYQALLDRDDVTAVYVPLPNGLHVDWTLNAIHAGKHVLCEKPIALDPADVDRIAVAAARAGVVVEEGFMYRHEPLTARVLDLVSGGAVGAVRTIVSGFTYAQGRPDDVRLDAALGGGALFDVGCYPISYACLLADQDPAAALGIARLTPGGVDEEFTGVLGYPGGVTASIYAGFRAAYHTWLEILGSEGVLTVANPFRPGPLERLRLERLGDTSRIEVRGSETLFTREIEHFAASVLDGAPTTITLAESRRTVAASAALHAAARAGGERA